MYTSPSGFYGHVNDSDGGTGSRQNTPGDTTPAPLGQVQVNKHLILPTASWGGSRRTFRKAFPMAADDRTLLLHASQKGFPHEG